MTSNFLKRLGLKGLSDLLGWSMSSEDFRKKINEFVSEDFFYNEKYYASILKNLDPEKGDRFFTLLRRQLHDSPAWKYGPLRLHNLWTGVFSRIGKYVSNVDRYCELGCGKHNPLGSSLVMYLNGANGCYSMDMDVIDWIRATESLNDLTEDILRNPCRWLFIKDQEEVFKERVKKLAFYQGGSKPDDAMLFDGAFRFSGTRIEDSDIENDSIDFMTSEAVLEYLNPFAQAIEKIYNIMSPGTISYHTIDFRDHRQYRMNMRYGFFHFMTENLEGFDCKELYRKGIRVNMLRYSEVGNILKSVGFEILAYSPGERQKLPPEVVSRLQGRYAAMQQEDLEILDAWCLIRKPEAGRI